MELPPHLSLPPLITISSGDPFIIISPLQLSPLSSTQLSHKISHSSTLTDTHSSSVSLVSLAGGTSQPLSLVKLSLGYKPEPIFILKRKASGYFHMLSPTSSTNFGSRSSLMTTPPLTSAQIELRNFPSPRTTHHLLHLWCPLTSKQTSTLTVVPVMRGQNLRGPFSRFFKGDGKNMCGVLIWLYGASPQKRYTK